MFSTWKAGGMYFLSLGVKRVIFGWCKSIFSLCHATLERTLGQVRQVQNEIRSDQKRRSPTLEKKNQTNKQTNKNCVPSEVARVLTSTEVAKYVVTLLREGDLVHCVSNEAGLKRKEKVLD